MKTIGVVVPCRNYETFLPDALASLCGQIEHRAVVVDDYSRNPYAVIQSAGDTPVLHLPEWRGLGIARNTGAAYLDTDLILFLDADDWLYPGALATLANLLDERPGAQFAYGNYTENGMTVATLPWSEGKPLLGSQNIASYCQLWRTSAFWRIGGYSAIGVAEDWELQRRAARAGYAAAHADAVIFEHRIHDGNKWTGDAAKYGGMAGVAKVIENYVK